MPIINIDNKIFALQTKNTSYIIGITEDGIVESLYWGKRIKHIGDFSGISGKNTTINMQGPQLLREECSSFGGMRFKETSLKVSYSDGTRDFRYQLAACKAEENSLELVLKDIAYPFLVHLHYELYPEEDIIKKWRVAENQGEEPIILERFYSGEYGIAGSGFESINYNGRWGAEFLQHSEAVESGKKVYESLYGLTAHTANPLFIVHKHAVESRGEVYYGLLEYSGNFKTVVEAVNSGFLNVLTGISDTDFSWTLKTGECFAAPAVYSGYSDAGFEKMSHTMHRFSLRHLVPGYFARKPLPVLYNSWYSTTFSVKCEEQIALAKRAANMGVELFVIDDGWFAGRNDDTGGLGDWYADQEKFPRGLKQLADEVHKLGMKFGVWIEPEMVNPDSQLFREHPDWIYAYPKREVLMGRNQYELDMANPEVVDYLIEIFDKLLAENAIEYIKWDMNRYAAEIGSSAHPAADWKELHYRNTQGIYRLIGELRSRHPKVEFEACASGGGRVDAGAMRYFDEYWVSDNTDGLDRLFIQESYSYLYPAKYMRAWLTDDFGMNRRRIPLNFSMHSAMCGVLGIGIDLNSTSDERAEQIAGYIEAYKEVREIIQFGDLYRLRSLKTNPLHAVQYVKERESVLFLFLDHERYGNARYNIKLRGLEAERMYQYELDGIVYKKSGAFLMNYGMEAKLYGDYDSRMILLRICRQILREDG